ncbi:biliverdin-producing heme oxygenase [Actibacterium ureilyticum]|uniref:biliverdin-producing heme oxygenase n=1 Tax=Actibacterium ureilyticum TaxID=1590614 RepID=UPI000BAADEC6|nr:biliverdin-producing heme oxygenase [Actibacterium ureilyticum]
MLPDFRKALKDATQPDHERVDRLLSAFDIATRDGFASFLAVHRRCYLAMLRAAAPGGTASNSLDGMLADIEIDLATLNAPHDVDPAPVAKQVDALALDYLIEGSRLGTQVLKRAWAGSRDPIVQEARAYFTTAPISGRWAEVCRALSEIPADSPRAETIIRDTKRLFGMFHDEAGNIIASQNPAAEVMS